MVQRTVSGLSPADAHASRNALLELTKGLVLDRFDDREPTFTPALVQAARDLADARPTDAGLSPPAIAVHLHVSVRTLQRAFASVDESLSACIRRRRLEEATAALTAPDHGSTSPKPPRAGTSPTAATSSVPSRSSTKRQRRISFTDRPDDSASSAPLPAHRRLPRPARHLAAC